MAIVGAALPKGVELQPDEIAATFVVPAPHGCNLNCPFCVVKWRNEAVTKEPTLTKEEYLQFLNILAQQYNLGLVGVLGHEPLLPESWECTRAILSTANNLGVPTTIITNGTYLADRVTDLETLKVAMVTVSLDSNQPELHNKTRRSHEAFDKTLSGLKVATASSLRERMLVASVLQPGKRYYLDGLPKMLSDIGIFQWVVSPLYKIGLHDSGRVMDDKKKVIQQLIQLQVLAKKNDVTMLVDDEFDELIKDKQNLTLLSTLQIRNQKRLEQVFRLSPTGSFSKGKEIFRQVDHNIPVWHPAMEEAFSFINKFHRLHSN